MTSLTTFVVDWRVMTSSVATRFCRRCFTTTTIRTMIAITTSDVINTITRSMTSSFTRFFFLHLVSMTTDLWHLFDTRQLAILNWDDVISCDVTIGIQSAFEVSSGHISSGCSINCASVTSQAIVKFLVELKSYKLLVMTSSWRHHQTDEWHPDEEVCWINKDLILEVEIFEEQIFEQISSDLLQSSSSSHLISFFSIPFKLLPGHNLLNWLLGDKHLLKYRWLSWLRWRHARAFHLLIWNLLPWQSLRHLVTSLHEFHDDVHASVTSHLITRINWQLWLVEQTPEV